MATKLYVGGLSYSATQDTLRDAFSKAGAVVSATILTDKMTGRSRGFGFVEMADEAGAQAAIAMYNGKTSEGLSYSERGLVVNEAKPLEPRAPRAPGFGGGMRRDRGASQGGNW